jgi:hypothetical protein
MVKKRDLLAYALALDIVVSYCVQRIRKTFETLEIQHTTTLDLSIMIY